MKRYIKSNYSSITMLPEDEFIQISAEQISSSFDLFAEKQVFLKYSEHGLSGTLELVEYLTGKYIISKVYSWCKERSGIQSTSDDSYELSDYFYNKILEVATEQIVAHYKEVGSYRNRVSY